MEKQTRILYAGDTRLDGAAAYLAGLLTHFGLPFDYLSSSQPIGEAVAEAKHGLYILSDYPVKNFTPAALAALVERVRGGAGLLMIGGWESFYGAAGEYHDSPLAQVLPVEMLDRDDRVNSPQPCLIERLTAHPIIDGLPFDHPPGIGGYNRVRARPTATTVLVARHFDVEQAGGQFLFVQRHSAPLLVVSTFGRGRVAAYASDLAPHWVGGLVDWGDARVTATAAGSHEIEVGNHYAELCRRMVCWSAGLI